jgi:hypothetical protein
MAAISATTLVENPDVLWARRRVTEGATPAERNSRVAFVAAVLHERHCRQQHHQEERAPMTACRIGGGGVQSYGPARPVARSVNRKEYEKCNNRLVNIARNRCCVWGLAAAKNLCKVVRFAR